MLDKMRIAKDNAMGKVKETAGKVLDNDKLELKGKLQIFQSKVEEGVDNLKEETAEKINEVIEGFKSNELDHRS